MAYVKWYGHATFEVVLDGVRFLVDPWISNPKSPLKSLDELPKVDFIVITHDHGDHLGEAVDIAKKFNAKVIAIYEIANEVSKKGVDAIGANIGGPIYPTENKGLAIILTQALHSSNLGAPTGVIIKGSEGTVYHAGDTGIFAGMELLGKMYNIDVAMLPIGGHFTMGPYEAAWATKLIKPKVVIPMHYGTFPVLFGSPQDFEQFLKVLGVNTKLVVLKPGEKFEF